MMSKNKENDGNKRKIKILNIVVITDRQIPLKPVKKALVTFQVDTMPPKVVQFSERAATDEKQLIEEIKEFLKQVPKPPDAVGKEFDI